MRRLILCILLLGLALKAQAAVPMLQDYDFLGTTRFSIIASPTGAVTVKAQIIAATEILILGDDGQVIEISSGATLRASHIDSGSTTVTFDDWIGGATTSLSFATPFNTGPWRIALTDESTPHAVFGDFDVTNDSGDDVLVGIGSGYSNLFVRASNSSSWANGQVSFEGLDDGGTVLDTTYVIFKMNDPTAGGDPSVTFPAEVLAENDFSVDGDLSSDGDATLGNGDTDDIFARGRSRGMPIPLVFSSTTEYSGVAGYMYFGGHKCDAGNYGFRAFGSGSIIAWSGNYDPVTVGTGRAFRVKVNGTDVWTHDTATPTSGSISHFRAEQSKGVDTFSAGDLITVYSDDGAINAQITVLVLIDTYTTGSNESGGGS